MRLSSKGDSLHARLAKTLVLPLLVLYAASGGLAYWAVRHYADRVYDRWLYDSLTSLARQVRLSGDRAALDLPQAAKEIFEWDDEDLTMFRVVGSRSGLLAGQSDLPRGGTHAETFRNATLFDAPVQGHMMRWATLQLGPEDVGEGVTVLVGETMRKRYATTPWKLRALPTTTRCSRKHGSPRLTPRTREATWPRPRKRSPESSGSIHLRRRERDAARCACMLRC